MPSFCNNNGAVAKSCALLITDPSVKYCGGLGFLVIDTKKVFKRLLSLSLSLSLISGNGNNNLMVGQLSCDSHTGLCKCQILPHGSEKSYFLY